MTSIQELFTQIDTNGDNIISAYEIKQAMANNTNSELATAYSQLQTESNNFSTNKFNKFTNQQGSMSEEMLKILVTGKSTAEEDTTEVAEEVQNEFPDAICEFLATIDSNSDGKYTKSEISNAYKNAATTNMQNFVGQFMTTNAKGKVIVNTQLLNFLGETLDGLFYFDTNKDGNFSDTELSNLTTAQNYFYQIDKSLDGKISQGELKNAYKTTSNENLRNMLSEYVDNNENFKTLSDSKSYINFLDLFGKLDTNRDGMVLQSESHKYLYKSTEYQNIDLTSDGKITLDDIKNYGLKYCNSNFVNAICKTNDGNLQKKIFKIVSHGKNYITASDWFDFANKTSGEMSDEQVEAIVTKAKGN